MTMVLILSVDKKAVAERSLNRESKPPGKHIEISQLFVKLSRFSKDGEPSGGRFAVRRGAEERGDDSSLFLCPQTSGSTSLNDGAEQSCDGDRIHSGRSGSPDFEKLQV